MSLFIHFFTFPFHRSYVFPAYFAPGPMAEWKSEGGLGPPRSNANLPRFLSFLELFRNYHTVFNHASFCMVNAWNRLIPINRRNKGNKWSRDQVPGIAKYGKKNKLLFFSKFLFLCLLPILLVPFLIPVLLKKCCLEIMKKTIPVLIITHRMLKLRMIWSATHSTRLLYSKVGAWQKHLLTSLSVNMADIYLLSSEKLHNESLCATMKTWPEQCQNYPQKTKYDQNFLKRKNDCKLWRDSKHRKHHQLIIIFSRV